MNTKSISYSMRMMNLNLVGRWRHLASSRQPSQ